MPEKMQLLWTLRGSSGAYCSAASQPQNKSFLCSPYGWILQTRLHLQLQAHDLEVQVRQRHIQSLIDVKQTSNVFENKKKSLFLNCVYDMINSTPSLSYSMAEKWYVELFFFSLSLSLQFLLFVNHIERSNYLLHYFAA